MNKKLIVPCLVVLALVAAALPSLADPGRGTDVQCYLWANNATSTIGVPYTPSSVYSFNSAGRAAAISVTRTAIGTYNVTCKGVGGASLVSGGGTWGPGGHVQVTAYGSEDADHCKVVSWVTGGADFTATVRCFNSAGAVADNRFDLLFLW